MANEKLCLKWNDFQNIVQTSFGELRGDNDFTDVTLACEDKSIKAHKVILSACSPFFKRLLQTHLHQNPLIYMRGLKSVDLVAIVDFIYLGEANVFQEHLETFLSLAEEFELKGLSGNSEEAAEEYPKESFPNQYQSGPEAVKKKSTVMKYEGSKNVLDKALTPIQPNEKQTTVIDPDIMATVESMIEKQANGFLCTKCDYTSNNRGHIREHVEKHIEGLQYPCNICNKVYRSSLTFRGHRRRGRCQNTVGADAKILW